MKIIIDIPYNMKYNENNFIYHERGMVVLTGVKIKEYLASKGITQTFISNKTGIPISTLNQALNGNRKMLAEEYFLICEILEVPLNKFVDNKTA